MEQCETGFSSIETQFYTLQKSLINDGALRPHSAVWDDRALSSAGGQRKEQRKVVKPPPKPVIERPKPPSAPSEQPVSPAPEPEEAPTAEESPPASAKKPSTPVTEQPAQPAYKYRPFVPNERTESEEVEKEVDHTPKVVRGDSVSIDPDFQQSQAIQEQQKPEELVIPRYEEQFRLLREVVVDLRTNLQILKVQSQQPGFLPTPKIEPVKVEVQEQPVDDTALRVLRRKIDGVGKDLEGQIQDLRRELYEFMARPREKTVEKVVEVKSAADVADGRRPVARDAPEVKDINVQLNVARAKAFLGEYDESKLLRITKLDEVPDLDDQPEYVGRRPIVEAPLDGPGLHRESRKVLTNPESPRPRPGGAKPGGGAVPGEGPPGPPGYYWPGMMMQRVPGGIGFDGHVVPQAIGDLTVLNAKPREESLEIIMPYIVELRGDLLLQLEAALDRIRQLENALQRKVDKDFVDAFFRKMRAALQETNERVISLSVAMPDRVTKEDLEAKVEEMIKTMPAFQESTIAGKTSVTCLLCGAKRAGIIPASLNQRGQIYKGRAMMAPVNTSYDGPPLPPLQVGP
jgi:hypothetical protein